MVTHTIKSWLPATVLVSMVACFLCIACSAPNRGLFAGKTAHQRYADKISNAGLKETSLGQNWFTAAGKGLTQPLAIKLPYKEVGYFDAAQPAAAGYRFTARRGDKVLIVLTKKPAAGFSLFLDLWQPVANEQPKLIAAADTAAAGLNYEVNKDGEYLLRLQPELLAGGEYTLEIRTGPSLDFRWRPSIGHASAAFGEQPAMAVPAVMKASISSAISAPLCWQQQKVWLLQ